MGNSSSKLQPAILATKNNTITKKMRTRIKEKTTETTNDDGVDTQLELLKFATKVQSRIKTDITEDFTLCKLNDQDKQGIIEMTVNAHAARRKMTQILKNSKQYTWKENDWTEGLNEETRKKMEEDGKKAFDMYMTKIYMTAILNRNVPKNHLVNFLKNEREETEPEPTTEKKIQNKIIKDKQDEKTKEN